MRSAPRLWCRLFHWMYWFAVPSRFWGYGGAGSAHCTVCGDQWERVR